MHPVAQLVARETQQGGGLHLVAMTVFKRLLHETAFDFAQERGKIDTTGGQVDVLL